jgi:Skp family chaperone for outer membrane proteins
MRNLVLLAVLVAACTGTGPVGVYDVNRIAAESTAAKAALDAVAAELKPRQSEAQKAVDAFQSAGGPLTAAALEQRKAEAQQKVDAFNEFAQRRRAEAMKPIEANVTLAVAKIAAARRMTVVLAAQGKLAFAAPGVDITDEVLAAIDGQPEDLRAARAAAKEAVDRLATLEARGKK